MGLLFPFVGNQKGIELLINNYEISFYKGEGPTICINRILLIEIPGNPIKKSILRTNENDERIRNVFDGIPNALSEDGNYNGIYANEYEVFQILF